MSLIRNIQIITGTTNIDLLRDKCAMSSYFNVTTIAQHSGQFNLQNMLIPSLPWNVFVYNTFHLLNSMRIRQKKFIYLFFSSADIKEAFELFDKDGDGRITCEELGTVMKSLGQNPTDEELKQMVEEVDTNSRYTVMKSLRQNTTDEELTQMVEEGDTNSRYTVMKSLAQNLTDEELKQMVEEVDTNSRYTVMKSLRQNTTDEELTQMVEEGDTNSRYTVMKSLGQNLTDEELKQMVEEVGTNSRYTVM